jgi:hypothetical protein
MIAAKPHACSVRNAFFNFEISRIALNVFSRQLQLFGASFLREHTQHA